MPTIDLAPPLARALERRGYAQLTPVQQSVAGAETKGRDLLVSARTGSGKTVAYGLAMAEDLLGPDGALPPAAQPLALIIAPTRELALQVHRELEWLFADTGAKVLSCVGGMDPRREQRALSAGVHIVVGTPGRLRDHLERGQLDLSALRAVVLDEADEMLDLGFREELEAILDGAPTDRRTLLFSATLPKPILSLARRYQRDALRIATSDGDTGHADIDYRAIAIAPSDLDHAVVNLLRYHDAGSALVFCNTREAVRRLHANLVERGFSVAALSGELTQAERNHALQAVRDRRVQVCVATDVAARGIDIPELDLVIHADLPGDAEALQHRSGRTGRAGRKGVSALLVPYPRRRRAEALLKSARITATWEPAPSPEDIRMKDQERLVVQLTPTEPATEDDRAVATRLLARADPVEVVAALVRARRSAMPSPEELVEGAIEPAPAREAVRPGFEDSGWFRIDLGRSRNAEARWILPLICRRGHVTRSEIGAIRVFDLETRFEIARAAVPRFMAALAKSPDENGKIEPLDDAEPPARLGRKPMRKPSKPGRARPEPHDNIAPGPSKPAPKPGPSHTSRKQASKLRPPKRKR
jgi:ATP-dependent RNA helicase DeaD